VGCRQEHRAAASIIDLHDRVPLLDPVGLREHANGSHPADGKPRFAHMGLQLLEVVERREPSPEFSQE
jgi:hypothetical protein